MGKIHLKKPLVVLLNVGLALSILTPLSVSFTARAAENTAAVEADWNTTYQTMDGVGSAYAYCASNMMLQLAVAGHQPTVQHLLDLTFSEKNGTGHDIVRVLIGDGAVTAGGATQSSPGWNPRTGLRADVSKPGFDVKGNPIPVNGTAGQYGYKMAASNRIYDGQADCIWPNEPAHEAGTLVPLKDFVWEYETWNKPIANDDGGPVNWIQKSGDNPVVIKNSPRTRKEIFDIDQIWTMKQAMRYGVHTFYACMWEAPYWMSKGGSNTPNKIIRDDQTADGKKIYYQAYADYLVNYIRGYWQQWGIPITHINPFNEPDLAGASPAYIREVVDDYIGPTLKSAVLPGGALYGIKNPDGKVIDFVPRLCALDGTNIAATISKGGVLLPELDSVTNKHKYLDVVTTHLYGSVDIGVDETVLKHKAVGTSTIALAPYDYTVNGSIWPQYLTGYKIWQAEFMNQDVGDGSSGAYTQRYGNQNINDAVRYAYLMTNMFTSNPGISAYVWWITWDNNGCDGSDLIRFVNTNSQQNAGHVGTLTGEYRAFKRFYGFGHFTRFMNPGDVRFSVTREPAANLNVVGFKSKDNKNFSITVTNANNNDSIQRLEFRLRNFPAGTKSVTVFRTSGSENQKKVAVIPAKGKFVVDVPSASIVTIVPSEGKYATFNGLDGERDIFSSLEAEGNDNGVAGKAPGNAGRAKEAVLLGNRDYLAYKNVNFADGSANGGVVRRHLLYLTALAHATSGKGGSLFAYVLPAGTKVKNVDEIIAKGVRVAEIAVADSNEYAQYQAKVDTGDQSAYGHKDLYIVTALTGSQNKLAVDRFLFGANDSDWSTAAYNSVVTIKDNVLTNGDFDTATSSNTDSWTTGRYHNGTFETGVTGPVLSASTLQSYSGLPRYLKNSSTSKVAGSARLAGRINAENQYDGFWQDVTGKMTQGEYYRFEGQFLSLMDGPLGYEVAAERPGDAVAALVFYDSDGKQLSLKRIGGRDMPKPYAARESGERAWFNGDTLVGSILEGGPLNLSSFQPVDVKVANWCESTKDAFRYKEPSGTAKVILAVYAKDANILYADELSIVPVPVNEELEAALTGSKVKTSSVEADDEAADTSTTTDNNASASTSSEGETALATATVAEKTGIFYVAPNGDDSNPGTYSQPFFGLAKAVAVAAPGSTIYLRGGSYNYTQTILVDKKGTAAAPFKVLAYSGEKPVLSWAKWKPASEKQRGLARGMLVTGAYWVFKGLEISYAPDNGVKLEGAHNTFEQVVFHHNGDTGLQIGLNKDNYSKNPDPDNLAAYNTIINCDSYRNADPATGYENADGFACKLYAGKDNRFYGCRAWENSDDGWDCFQTNYLITIENCWTWHNGDPSLWGKSSFAGDGNGFKLGGNDAPCPILVKNCVAFDLPYGACSGFSDNNNGQAVTLYNCVAWKCGRSFNMNQQPHVIKNCVDFDNVRNAPKDFDSKIIHHNNSWNLSGVVANYDDFISTSVSDASAAREADGSLPRNGFARLKADSDLIDKGVNVGLPYSGSAPDLGAYERQ